MTAGGADAHPVADARPDLRTTFAHDLAARLPRLRALGAAAGDLAAGDLDDARRDAHTLGSSAIIVGEPEIARLAHAVELELAAGPVQQLVAALEAYTP